MPDDTSATRPGAATNGTLPEMPQAAVRAPLPAINRRLPRGESLPDYAVEYFNQLVAQYLTLPAAQRNAQNTSAVAVAESLIGEQEQEKAERERGIRWPWERKHYLNWGDVSGMEMALLQLLPPAYLQRYAWNLRARYHEVAGQAWYDSYRQSKPPEWTAPPPESGPAAVSVTGIPPGGSGLLLLTPAAPELPAADTPGDSPATAELRADLSVLLSDLQRLRSTIKAREEKHSRISLIGALLAAVSLTLALAFYGAPSVYTEWHGKQAPPRAMSVVSAALPAPTASAPASKPTDPKPKAGTPLLAAASPAPASAPLRILQMSALVILCGVLGGLISMLRRLQALPPGSTPLFDTIALDAG